MDVLYGTDHKLGDMDGPDMTDFLDSDMFNSSMVRDRDSLPYDEIRMCRTLATPSHMFYTNDTFSYVFRTNHLGCAQS